MPSNAEHSAPPPRNTTRFFGVKNLEKFQHYKDRNPPWIKLYNELLDDYDFACLQDASKLHLILIWLLASRSDNRIPYNAKWVGAKINASEPVDLPSLVSSGFLFICDSASKVLAGCKQDARPETETETETEGEKEAETKTDFSGLSAGRPGGSRDNAGQTKPADPKGKKPDAPRKQATGPHAELIRHHGALWHAKFGTKYDFKDGKDGTAVGRILKSCGDDIERAKRMVSDFMADDETFISRSGYTLSFLQSQTNLYLSGGHRNDKPEKPTPVGTFDPAEITDTSPDAQRALDELHAQMRAADEAAKAGTP